MHRIQIQLTEAQADRLRRESALAGRSVSDIVREAVDRHFELEVAASARRRAIASVGGFRSGRSDISERHDDALAEDFA